MEKLKQNRWLVAARDRAQPLIDAVQSYSGHNGSQLAASISYYSLLSLFPALIAATAVFGLVIGDGDARRELIDALQEALPLNETNGRDELEELIRGVTSNAGTVGLAGLAGLIFSGSALMSSMRAALSVIFEVEEGRSAVKGKLFDIGLLLLIGVLIAASFAVSIATGFGLDLADDLNLPGPLLGVAAELVEWLVPLALFAVGFAILYRLVPRPPPALRDVWPGVAFAVIGVEVVKRAFGFYLQSFADYSAVYGSLGAVIAYLAFTYLATVVFLIGAEIVAKDSRRDLIDGQVTLPG